MNVNSVNPSFELFKATQEVAPNEAPQEGFGAYLKNSFNEVNGLLNTADTKSNDMAVGKAENLHDAMISFEKADTAFKLLVQVRNRAIEAYHEIMRMQL